MKDLLASDILGIIIQTIGAIIVAMITKWGVIRATGKNDGRDRKQPAGKHKAGFFGKPQNYLGGVVIGVIAAITFCTIGFAYNTFAPKPTVEINSPKNGEGIEVRIAETGSGSFFVNGKSTRVVNKPSLRVYILVHPADPFAEGWWIQPAVVMNSDGTWSGQAWIGDPGFPPHVGDLVDIIAIVVAPDHVQSRSKVNDPKDLNPATQSSVVRFSIKSTK